MSGKRHTLPLVESNCTRSEKRGDDGGGELHGGASGGYYSRLRLEISNLNENGGTREAGGCFICVACCIYLRSSRTPNNSVGYGPLFCRARLTMFQLPSIRGRGSAPALLGIGLPGRKIVGAEYWQKTSGYSDVVEIVVL